MQSFDLLVHFDPEELLILAYDVSPHGLGTNIIPLHANWLRKAYDLCIVPQRKRNTCILTRKHCPSPLELYCAYVGLFIVFVEADRCDKCGALAVHERLFSQVVERAEHYNIFLCVSFT